MRQALFLCALFGVFAGCQRAEDTPRALAQNPSKQLEVSSQHRSPGRGPLPKPYTRKPLETLEVTHGVASSPDGQRAALIWSRANRAATMHVRVALPDGGYRLLHARAEASADYTATIRVDGLEPGTTYSYAVWFSAPGPSQGPLVYSAQARGVTRTQPDDASPVALSMAWGGDIAGQNVCRDAREGFAIMRHIPAQELDFFLGLGDLIYADNRCRIRGAYGNAQVPAAFTLSRDLEGFRAHWRYNRADQGYQAVLARTPLVAIWDDHEVINDFGPAHDQPAPRPGKDKKTPHLLPLGLQAFREYNPAPIHAADPKRLYRALRWGEHAELFILDTRQYRDSNSAPDRDDQPKTMLGAAQRAWLQQALKASDATWKIIVSSVPLSVPTGLPGKRDGWASAGDRTGFSRELAAIVRAQRADGVKNVLWITTDVHFAAVFRYTPDAKAPEFAFHEVITGPLSAGLFPNKAYDRSLGAERLFFYGPVKGELRRAKGRRRYEEAKRWMSFGKLDVSPGGLLGVQIINGLGQQVHQLWLRPR